MAKKLDGQAMLKYAVLGAGALVVPAVVGMIPQVTDLLANLPMIGDPLWEGISILGVVLSGAGVGLVDTLLYNK